jgi:hypothetical protein
MAFDASPAFKEFYPMLCLSSEPNHQCSETCGNDGGTLGGGKVRHQLRAK